MKTMEQENTHRVAFFLIQNRAFSIFLKSAQNYKMLYIPYERPKKGALNFAKTKGVATLKRQPRP